MKSLVQKKRFECPIPFGRFALEGSAICNPLDKRLADPLISDQGTEELENRIVTEVVKHIRAYRTPMDQVSARKEILRVSSAHLRGNILNVHDARGRDVFKHSFFVDLSQGTLDP